MKLYLTALLLCLSSLPAAATELSYSHLDLAYTSQSNDFTDGNSTGYELGASWDVGRSGFALQGAFRHASFDGVSGFPSLTLKPDSYRLGGAYHMAAGEFLDFVVHADYVHAKTTLDIHPLSAEASDTGYLVGLGFRGKISDNVEFDAFVDHDDTGLQQSGSGNCNPTNPFSGCFDAVRQDGAETLLSLAGRYAFTRAFGLGLEYRDSSLQGNREWLLSGRWNF